MPLFHRMDTCRPLILSVQGSTRPDVLGSHQVPLAAQQGDILGTSPQPRRIQSDQSARSFRQEKSWGLGATESFTPGHSLAMAARIASSSAMMLARQASQAGALGSGGGRRIEAPGAVWRQRSSVAGSSPKSEG